MTSSSLRPVNRCTVSLNDVILRSTSTVKTPILRFSRSRLNCPCKILVSVSKSFADMIGSPLYVATLCNNDITQEHEIGIRSYARWKELIGVRIQESESRRQRA